MRNLRIVVVEDEYYVRKGLVHRFDWARLGCEVVGEASNGKEGLAVIQELAPDLVIADIEMPIMSGLEMAERLQLLQSPAAFLFLTAHEKFSYAQKAIKLEAVDYLLKPFRPEDLEQCILRLKSRLHLEETAAAGAIFIEIQPQSSYIRDAVQYVHQHYAEDIANSTVADALSLSEAYFCRLFKKEAGCTFTQYLTNYRMHIAAKLLVQSHDKINTIAEQVGFADGNYFSLTFKKLTGLSPREYQEKNR
jgi:two-component system response regulator YesN